MNAPAANKRQPIPFGKYLLLDRINIGGMAEVWRGKTFGAGGFEKLIAIKRILPNIAEDEEFISMFIDEAKITVQLEHANIGQVLDLGQIQSSYYIAMEYISGKDMRAIFDRCRKKGEPPPIPLACYLIAKSCEGLDYAHRKNDRMGKPMNIVHRDVSPQNALVSYDGEVKVIDFGIAKAAGKATKTQAGILKGKFGYMSPEQIRGLPLDRRSDVFAIGVCLYEMLTGERLFVGDSDFSVLEKVRKVEVLPPSTYNRKIPDALEKIVMKALAKDVDDRYQYASELADDLQRFLITSESVFGRKDLAAYMRATFAEDVEKEKQRIIEYADIKAPEGMLAAAQMGFGGAGAGFAPPAATPVGPPMVTPSAGRTQQMPPPALTPSVPPVIGADARRNSGQSIPRLTAVAPLLTNEEGGQSTVLVSGENVFKHPGGVAAGPGSLGPPVPDGPGDFGDDGFATNPEVVPPELDKTVARTGGPQLVAAALAMDSHGPALATHAGQRRGNPPPRPRASPGTPIGVVREKVNTGVRAHHIASEPSKVNPRPKLGVSPKLLALVGGGVGLLVLVLVAALLLRGGPTGLVAIYMPDDFTGEASVNINGEDILEADGKKPTFPLLRKVAAGQVTIRVKAPGYETLMETLTVEEGTKPSPYRPKMIRKGAPPAPAPAPDPGGPAPAPEGEAPPPGAPAANP